MDNLNEIKETLKDMFKAAITNAKDGDEKGEWITINGTHVFIPEGVNREEAVEKFLAKKKGSKSEKKEEKKQLFQKVGDKLTQDILDTVNEAIRTHKICDKINVSDMYCDLIADKLDVEFSDHDWQKFVKKYGDYLLKPSLPKELREEYKKISNAKISNDLSEIIKNCKPETKEDLKILKGLKDILEEQ